MHQNDSLAIDVLELRREVLALRRLLAGAFIMILLFIFTGAAFETQIKGDMSVSGVLKCLGLKVGGSVELTKNLDVEGDVRAKGNITSKNIEDVVNNQRSFGGKLASLETKIASLEALPHVKGWSIHLGLKNKGQQDYTFDVPPKTTAVSAWVSQQFFGSAYAVTRTVTFKPGEMKCRVTFDPQWDRGDIYVNVIAVCDP